MAVKKKLVSVVHYFPCFEIVFNFVSTDDISSPFTTQNLFDPRYSFSRADGMVHTRGSNGEVITELTCESERNIIIWCR